MFNSRDLRANALEERAKVESPAKAQLLSVSDSIPDRQVTSSISMAAAELPLPQVDEHSDFRLLVDGLDIHQLQKLALEQQAQLDFEREEYRQARIMTNDAITIMKNARAAQKRAEKLASRERMRRKKIELKLEKMANALSRATLILEKQKAAQV
ncbi:MAG: hypothetical protein AB8B64_22785 [Granulosicoccus sp.]